MQEVEANSAKNGIKWFGSAALHTEANGWSSGVAVFAQGFLDMWQPKEAVLVPGRCVMAFVRLPAIGVIALYVVYLECNIGLADGNVCIMEKIATHVA